MTEKEYMQHCLDLAQKGKGHVSPNPLVGCVIVKEGKIIGKGANGSDFHETHECERVKQNIPTGEGYELCEGCHPKNHSEPRAIQNAKDNGHETDGADLYLWGHWWCCEPCWNVIKAAGINQVYLAEGSHELFDKNHTNNIIGNQCSI